MNKWLSNTIIFLAGGAVGAAAFWFFVKKKYEKRTEEEVESVKQAFFKLEQDAQARADDAKNKPDILTMAKAINYSAISTPVDDEEEETEEEDEEDYALKPLYPDVDTSKPYILNRPPTEHDEPFHAVITVMHYADGTYADTHGTEMEIEDYIGRDLMTYVEDSDQDELYIRNEELELDLDIVKDTRTYDEIMFG